MRKKFKFLHVFNHYKPYYPFLLNFLFILSIYQVNVNLVSFKSVLISFLNGQVVTGITLVVLAVILRNIYSASLLSGLTSVLALIYPFIVEGVSSLWSAGVYLLALASIISIVIILTVKNIRKVIKLTHIMNLFAVCALSVSGVLTIFAARSGATPIYNSGNLKTNVFNNPMPSDTQNHTAFEDLPDIVFMVLDGYGRQDVLKDVYNFDNAPFIDFLTTNNFYVAKESRANYTFTMLSIASAFNGAYITTNSAVLKVLNYAVLDKTFAQSAFSELLLNNNYNIALTYSADRKLLEIQNEKAQKPKWARDFDSMNFNNLVRRRLAWKFPFKWQSFIANIYNFPSNLYYRFIKAEWTHSARIKTGINQMVNYPLGKSKKPTFLYSHVIAPHPPFVFSSSFPESETSSYNEANMWRASRKADSKDYQIGYSEHLQKINEMMERAIKSRISNKGERDLVFVLVSDHGPASEFDFNDIENTNQRERVSNLCAVYSSAGDYEGFYQNMTLINLVRLITGKYLCEEPLPLLRDRSFVSSWSNKFLFIEYVEK
ncbi:MAG: sulfatase-like hydrolase/transferase [Kiritimatiellia bacterium]